MRSGLSVGLKRQIVSCIRSEKHSEWLKKIPPCFPAYSIFFSWLPPKFQGRQKKLAVWRPRGRCKQLLNFQVCSWSWFDIVSGRVVVPIYQTRAALKGGRFFWFFHNFSIFSGEKKNCSRNPGRIAPTPVRWLSELIYLLMIRIHGLVK